MMRDVQLVVPVTREEIEKAFARYRPYIEDWAAFVDTLLRPLPTVVWVNPLRVSPEEGERLLGEEGVEVSPLGWYRGAFRVLGGARPATTWLYAAGLIHIQEEVSLLPVVLLDPRPGERVLDMCAAPGGKTALIAAHMQGTGTVMANDVNFTRMRAVRHAVERLGLVNVSMTLYNGANLPRDVGAFDRVLVDVPCSCEGTSRKNPEVLTFCGVDESLRHQGLQKALLRKAVQLCRPGGRIVYATCTYAPEENEAVVDAVLREMGEQVRLVPVSVPGFRVTEGFTEWYGQRFHPTLTLAARVWPHMNDTGGFFVAVLEKSPESSGELMPPTVCEQWPEQVADPALWIRFWHDRFGIPEDTWTRLCFLRRGRKGIDLVHQEHRPPGRPRPEAVGIPLLHTKSATPKPTTAAALFLARRAVRQVVDLTQAQVAAYLRREAVVLSGAQAMTVQAKGFVLVRYRGYGLGTGLWRPGEKAGGGILESLFPKGWGYQRE